MWRVYATYYKFLWHYKWRMMAFGVAILGYGLARNIDPYFYKLFLEAIPQGKIEWLWKLLLIYGVVRFLRLIFDNLTAITGDWVLLEAARDARVAVFRRVQDLDFAFHLSKSTGSLISAFKRGDGAFFDTFHNINIQTVRVVIGFGTMMYFLTGLDGDIALVMVMTMMVNILMAGFLIRKNIATRKEFNKAEDEISDIIVDNLINFETVKLFAREKHEYERLKDSFIGWLNKLWAYANSFRVIDLSIGATGNISLLIVLGMGLIKLMGEDMTTAEYVMVLAFVTEFYPQFFELIYQLRNVAKHSTDMQKYMSILDEPIKITDPKQPVKKTTITGEITFDKVTFTYPGGKKGAVQKIDLAVRQGQSIALVGSSGVGKTTLVKLLMRFYDPDSGRILIDGIDIKEFAKSQLRSFMGVVPQEPILFNNTIGYNIAYGAKKTTWKEIRAAAKMANLDDFIESLPAKYETHVGERGVKLSGGQKQRLAIARMILSDPEIIIFDEATSQLDSESERKIQEAFWKAAENKTTIIIAHRLSTVAKADKIVVMEKGKIAEIGSHRELLQRKDSLYSKFWKLQMID